MPNIFYFMRTLPVEIIMNSYERVTAFMRGEAVDRPPFMPLAIEWVSRQYNADYRKFVYDPVLRADAYLWAAKTFGFDCILPDADFYEQLEDFGAKPVYEEGSGYHAAPILSCPEDAEKLELPKIAPGTRMGNRLETLRLVAEKAKGETYIYGICIGPFTEYCNARSMEEAFYDMADDTDAMMRGVMKFHENCKQFILAQLDAGADAIQIVEPSCSLISPDFYKEHIYPLHKELVKLSSNKGGFSRLHICGDTNKLLPYTLSTGTPILDVDYQVDLKLAASLLKPGQALCGNLDPAADLLQGNIRDLESKVREAYKNASGRIIIAAGCDIPPDTSKEMMKSFFNACCGL